MIAFTYLEPNPVNSESNSNMSALYSMDATEPNRNPENSHFNNVIDNSIFEQPVTIEDEENQHPVFHDHPLESEHAHVKTTPNVYDKAAMLHIGSVLILENV